MKNKVPRKTVDLTAYPDMVVIYLGIRVNVLTGLKTLLGFGPKIDASVKAQPDGLLLHEQVIWSLLPPHVGMRQYWRDFESLERWSRSGAHLEWWKKFMKDSGGTGVWHETYFMRGGMEAIYTNLPAPLGLMRFAPVHDARGSMFSARQRLGVQGEPTAPTPISETEYADPS